MAGTEKALPLGTRVRVIGGRWSGKEGVIRAIYGTGVHNRFDYDICLELYEGKRGVITRRPSKELRAMGGVVRKSIEKIVAEQEKTEEDLRREIGQQVRSEITTKVKKQMREDVERRFFLMVAKRRLEMKEASEEEFRRKMEEIKSSRKIWKIFF